MAHPLAFAGYLRHIGAPVARHFQRQGLPALCEDPGAFVPLEKAWGFFDSAAQAEDPMLGWRVGLFVGDKNLHASLVKKLVKAPTLLEALRRLVGLVSAEASHLRLGLHDREKDVLFYTHYPDMKGVTGYHSSQAYQLGVYIEVVRHFLGSHWTPPVIGIEYPVVPKFLRDEFSGSRVLPRQRVGYISIPRSSLHGAPLDPPSPNGGEEPLVLTQDFDYLDTLRALLRPHLSEGYPDTSLAASLMDTSVRTLARRLKECGATYRGVVDHMRFAEAKRLLENPNVRITDVANEVGFEDPAHFARMFRRIGGVSPREFRRGAAGD